MWMIFFCFEINSPVSTGKSLKVQLLLKCKLVNNIIIIFCWHLIDGPRNNTTAEKMYHAIAIRICPRFYKCRHTTK